MNDNLFACLYGIPRAEGTAYLGTAAYKALTDARDAREAGGETNLIYFNEKITIDNRRLSIRNKAYPYEVVMPRDKETIMFDRLGQPGYDMADAVILPIEDNFVPDSPFLDLKMEARNVLFLCYRREEWKDDLVPGLLLELNNANRGYSFGVDNAYLDLKRKMDDYGYDMDRWMILSVSVMVLCGIGCVGAMFLFLDKQRHFTAVSIACGSTFWRIALEKWIEIFLVLITGAILGISASPLLKRWIVYTGELKVSLPGIAVVIMLAFFFSILSVLLGMRAVKAKDVAAALKDE